MKEHVLAGDRVTEDNHNERLVFDPNGNWPVRPFVASPPEAESRSGFVRLLSIFVHA